MRADGLPAITAFSAAATALIWYSRRFRPSLFPQEVVWLVSEALVRGLNVLLQHPHQRLRSRPATEWFRRVRRVSKVERPDAGLGLVLLQIRPPVRGESEGHLVAPVVLDGDVAVVDLTDMARIVFALDVEHRKHVLALRLSFNRAHHRLVDEEGVVHVAAVADAGIRRPLGDCHIVALLRSRAFGVANRLSVGLPTGIAHRRVDKQARLLLGLGTLVLGFQNSLDALGFRDLRSGLRLRLGFLGQLLVFGLACLLRRFRLGLGFRVGRLGVGPHLVLLTAEGHGEPQANAVGYPH